MSNGFPGLLPLSVIAVALFERYTSGCVRAPSTPLRGPMPRLSFASRALLLVCTLGIAGCPGTDPPMGEDTGPSRTDSPVVLRCSPTDDPDSDTISTEDEGSADTDMDGTPNSSDDDSDADTILDRDEACDLSCVTTPSCDLDRDTTVDYLDPDGNGDGVPDRDQLGTDADGDGIPDGRDNDLDGDGIANPVEFGMGTTPADTDGDGTVDQLDDDSDGDTIGDRHEGSGDPDRDDLPSFRDLDSDSDGIDDAIEAGDGSVETPPSACGAEVDPVTGEVMGDGYPDFLDVDSDNDGAGDGEEVRYGADPCDINSDDDEYPDVVEVAYARLNCPDPTAGGEFCTCATSTSCTIPADDYFVVLPYLGPVVRRELEFGTTIRVADIFFITDTTGSMGGTVANVQATVAAPGGLIDRISESIPDVWIGGGQHDDMPFGGYGSPPDEPLIVAITSTDPDLDDDGVTDNAAIIQTAFNAIRLHGGNDGPESQTEALYQIVTGDGGTWMGSGPAYTMPNYEGRCLDTGWGAPCFRDAALPIVVHFTDICSHNGPPGEDSACDPYTGITPAPAEWTDMIAEMNRRGAKYIGVAASSGSNCAVNRDPASYSPCYFLHETARETGSVDLEGRDLVYDLPNTGTDPTAFADAIVGAIETVATRVPLDVDTGLRDDPSDGEGVDARRFIVRRQPACNTAGVTECWEPPPGYTREEAVALYDTSTFFGVIPGTLVRFTIDFQNSFLPGAPETRVYVAFIDVRGGGSSVLDTRQVIILIPADSGGGFG